MNWLDRAIGFVAPKSGLRRMRARAAQDVLLSYEGARTGRRTSGWTANGTSSNAEIGPDLARLRERSRELIRNNQFAAKAASEWATKIVGTGIIPRSKTGTKIDETVDALWAEFCKNCSADDLPHFYALQALVARSWFESGEVLVRFRTRQEKDGLTVPLQLQILESDFLDLSKTTSIQTGYIIQGVEFDQVGRRVNYWLHPQHPGEVILTFTGFGIVSKAIPADQIMHIYEPGRPGQVRGVPRLAPVMLTMRDIDDWETAEIVRKKTEACLVAFVELNDESSLGTQRTDTKTNQRIEKIAPGSVEYLRLGEKVTFNQPTGVGGYADYKFSRVRDLSAGIGFPYELLSGDLSKVNYSSYRGGLVSFRDLVESAQYNVLIPKLCQPTWDRFINAAILAGELPEGDYPVEWNPPAFDLLDRLAEAQADRAMVRLGTLTIPQAISRQGYDPEKQLNEISATNKKLDALGIISDGDPRYVNDKGTGQPVTTDVTAPAN